MTIPATKPSRPVYPPPVPVGQVPHPGGTTPAETAYRTQQAVADLYTRWRAAHPKDIEPNVLKDNAGAFSVSDAAQQLPGVLDAVKQDAKDAIEKRHNLIMNNRVDGTDTAGQIAAQRFWDRSRRSLDAIREPGKIVAAAQELIANADGDQVKTLTEELPSYLASRQVPAGWLPRVLASKIPGLEDAEADERVKARQLSLLTQNHYALTRAMEKDIAAPPLLDPSTATALPYSDSSDELSA